MNDVSGERGAGDLRLPPRWRLERRLGRGGQGDVWLAHDRQLEQLVAVKILTVSDDSRGMGRLRREVGLGRRLEHPHLVPIYELLESGPVKAIVMEYMPGGSVGAEVKKGPVDLDRALVIAEQVLEVLAYLHAKKIVHRDVKPSNLLIDHDGSIRLGDLGLMRPLESVERITRTNTAVGTLAYMSPEQVRGEEVAPATDLYSLGTSLYAIVTGELPFAGGSDLKMVADCLGRDPAAPRQLRPECPRWFSRFIMRLLEKKPRDRWVDGAQALRAFRKQRWAASPRTMRRWAALGGAVLVLAGGAGWAAREMSSGVATARMVGTDLVVFDQYDRELWRQPYDRPPRDVLVADVIGDASPEVVAAKEWSDPGGVLQATIEVFSRGGRVLASFPALGEGTRWPKGRVSRGVQLSRLGTLDYDGDGREELVWIVHHPKWSPSALCIWGPRDDPSPEVLLFNSGHLRGFAAGDLDSDGAQETVCWGWNNAMGNQLAVAVIAPSWGPSGYSPDMVQKWPLCDEGIAKGCSVMSYVPLGPVPVGQVEFQQLPTGFSLSVGTLRHELDASGMPMKLAGIRSVPFWADLARTLARIELGKRRSEEEAEEFTSRQAELLADDSFDLAAMILMGQSMARSGDNLAAARCLDEARSRSPDVLYLRTRAAELRAIAGQFDQSRRELLEVMRIPGARGPFVFDAFSVFVLVDCLAPRGDSYWDGLATLFSDLVASPGSRIEHDTLAARAFFRGDWDDPNLDLQPTLEDFAWVRVSRDWAEMERTGDTEVALQKARAAQGNPELETVSKLFEAYILLERGEADRALALVDRTMGTMRFRANENILDFAWWQLGSGLKARCLQRMGRGEEAAELLELTRRRAPGAWFAIVDSSEYHKHHKAAG